MLLSISAQVSKKIIENFKKKIQTDKQTKR